MTAAIDSSNAGDDFDVVIVGAGFNGLYQLFRLRQEGFRVRLFDSASGLGGVWHWNCYPGARVDSNVPNYEYSIEAVWRDWIWAEKYPGWEELQRYFEHVDRALDLSRDIQLDTRISSARFDETTHRWTVEMDGHGSVVTRYLVMCTGFASKPYVPDLPGLADFAGECHHTARWPAAGVELAGRRVSVLGTGASGVQVVQEAGKAAEQLTVFQRSPVTALPMQQERLDRGEQIAQKAEYPELFVRRNEPPGSFHDLRRMDVSALDVSNDERQRIYDEAWQRGGFHFWVGTFSDTLVDEQANRLAYNYWRDRTRERIDDPLTAELLAPTEPPYPFGTKRPSLEQDYYEMFNRRNVDLVDLHTTPITSITETGIRTTEREVDCDLLVLATGFDANTGGLTQIDLTDTNGRTLAERWTGEVDTNFGLAIPGFPNLLMLYGPQSSTAFCNGPTCAEIQGEWVVDFLGHLRDRGSTRFDTTETGARAWSRHLDEIAEATLFSRADSWYMGANVPGKRRQLLNHPMSDLYIRQIQAEAETDYPNFLIS